MKIIDVRGLRKSFGKKEVIHDISFSVDQGEVLGFLGPNGAGKTTTMRIILGLLEPDAGDVLVLGEKPSRNPRLRMKIGVLLEDPGLFEKLTARQNLRYYAEIYGIADPDARIQEMLDKAGLHDRADELVKSYSAGMKKKTGLARALLHGPEILIIDEPSNDLDPQAQKEFRDLILRMSKEMRLTVFMNSHNLDEVQKICTKVAIIDSGNLKVCDKTENLIAEHGELEYTIVMASEGDAKKAARILKRNMLVKNAIIKDASLTCIVKGGKFRVNELVGAGLEVLEFKKTKESLEDIYLEFVGRETA